MNKISIKTVPPLPDRVLRATGTEGTRRVTGVPVDGQVVDGRPDPEVTEKTPRRRFSGKYKSEILRQTDSCPPGQMGALLRREGLYFSHLITWRRQRDQGTLEALSPKKRGRKIQKPDLATRRITELERENDRLKRRLKKAETIIEVQKKISEIIGLPFQEDDNEG